MQRGRRLRLLVFGVLALVGGITLLIVAWRVSNDGTSAAGLPSRGSGPVPAATTGTGSTGADPDTVHEQWVAALQHDDQATALALSAPQEQQAGVVDAAIEMMRRYVPAQTETGGVTNVDVQPVTTKGDERIGTSVWTFVKSKACFQATLAQGADTSWRVRQWQRIPCP